MIEGRTQGAGPSLGGRSTDGRSLERGGRGLEREGARQARPL